MRFTNEHIKQWREDGFVLIADFFGKDELSPVLDDFETLYHQRGKGEGVGTVLDVKKDGSIGASHAKQFLNFDSLPYKASSAINLISLHPALIDFARGLLGFDKVHLYQSHTWAKYTGEADYDQAFHCDFGNHTLTVPSDDVALRAVDFVIYLTDVTDEHGALHYVTKPDSCELLGSGARPTVAQARGLAPDQRRLSSARRLRRGRRYQAPGERCHRRAAQEGGRRHREFVRR